MELEQELSEYVARTAFADLPDSTVAATKRLILDTCGATLAGIGSEGCAELARLVESWGGAAQARTFTGGPALPAHNAALLNASYARALEIDDVHEKALLHATATMVPVALAISDLVGGTSGQEFLAAVAVGIDVAARLSLAPQVDVLGERHKLRPLSFTYQTGTLVGAMVAARLLGAGPDGIRNALGIGYSQVAGNQQCLLEGALTVRIQQGLSASAAVLSAQLNQVGITGARHSLTGKFGFFDAYYGAGGYDLNSITYQLGKAFETDEVSIKPYPCCKYTHTGIAAALEARSRLGRPIEADDDVTIVVRNAEYHDVVCQPPGGMSWREAVLGQRGWVHAQFSLPYVVSVALLRGGVELLDFTDEQRADEAVLGLMERLNVRLEDDRLASGRVLPTPGEVIITDPFGGRTTGFARFAKGHPENPMSFEEATAKFRSVTGVRSGGYADAERERLIGNVARLEMLADARVLLDRS